MPALFDYTNVYETALSILVEKGYQVWGDKSIPEFWAEREGWDFVSESPCGLLGLVAIFEQERPILFRDNWWKKKDLNIYDQLVGRPARPYRSVTGRDVSGV